MATRPYTRGVESILRNGIGMQFRDWSFPSHLIVSVMSKVIVLLTIILRSVDESGCALPYLLLKVRRLLFIAQIDSFRLTSFRSTRASERLSLDHKRGMECHENTWLWGTRSKSSETQRRKKCVASGGHLPDALQISKLCPPSDQQS